MKLTVKLEVDENCQYNWEIDVDEVSHFAVTHKVRTLIDTVLLENKAFLINSLFEQIGHGTDEHRKWLQKAIDNHFRGLPVEQDNPYA